jgi:hypothetical protein
MKTGQKSSIISADSFGLHGEIAEVTGAKRDNII